MIGPAVIDRPDFLAKDGTVLGHPGLDLNDQRLPMTGGLKTSSRL